MEQTTKNIQYYRRLPYTLYVEPLRDSDGTNYWTAEYLELRGCKTDGITEGEPVANVQQLFDEYISGRLGDKLEIPEPTQIPTMIKKIWIRVQERAEDTQQTGADFRPEVSILPNELITA